MIKYKINILKELENKGYTMQKIRNEKIIGQGTLTKIRQGKIVAYPVIDCVCTLLQCQPGDLLEWVPDDV